MNVISLLFSAFPLERDLCYTRLSQSNRTERMNDMSLEGKYMIAFTKGMDVEE